MGISRPQSFSVAAQQWFYNDLTAFKYSIIHGRSFLGSLQQGKTLLSVLGSSYVIYLVTSLLDTPFVYWARKIKPRSEV